MNRSRSILNPFCFDLRPISDVFLANLTLYKVFHWLLLGPLKAIIIFKVSQNIFYENIEIYVLGSPVHILKLERYRED